MSTQVNKPAETARQLAAKEKPLKGEKCVRKVTKEWVDDLMNLYDSADEFVNRDYAIITKLREVYDSGMAHGQKYLLDHVDKKARLEYANTFLVSDGWAEKSSMKFVVKWMGRTDKKRKNDGRFRLFLNKEGKEEQVHFKRKSSFILYLIYLLDVYRSEKAEAIDLAKRNTQFCDLFYKVYAYEGGMEQFKTLHGKGNSEQELLRHCLSDIRLAIRHTCELLNEEASPYILDNKQSYLRVLKKNLVFDERIFEM